MRIMIVGAGGVGGYFGARLQAAGRDVAFVARGAHLAALRERGLRIESPRGDLHLARIAAADDPAALGQADLILIAVKLTGTADAIEAIRPVVGPSTIVASLQNGVDAEPLLVEAFGEAPVMGGVAHISAALVEPGLIRQVGSFARIQLGELAGGSSARLEALTDQLTVDGMAFTASPDIRRAIWEKFVFLSAMSAATAAARAPIGVLRGDPDCRAWLVELIGETAAVARAQGIALDAGTEATVLDNIDKLPETMIASMAHDLGQAKPLELDWLSGAVLRLGRETGIPTPAHAHAFATLKPHRLGADVARAGH